MEKSLINSLLRIYHSDKMRHAANKVLSQFAQDYNIGSMARGSIVFSDTDKDEIRQLLMASEGIDASTTFPDQWAGLSRTESLQHGSNEKLTSSAVRSGRVAAKALPGRSLLFDGQSLVLPAGSNLDIAWEQLIPNNQHKSVLVVENWEAFDRIHTLSFAIGLSDPNPLVLFRGSPVYRQDHVMSLLRALSLPVYAFVDFDPAGLVIAQSLPCFAGIVAPTMDVLNQALLQANNHDRYIQQLPETRDTLNGAKHRDIVAIWKMLQLHGKALPQEYFLATRGEQPSMKGGAVLPRDGNAHIRQRRKDLQAKISWLRTFPVVTRIILFGSCARGEARANSDVDIAVILACPQKDVQNVERSIRNTAFLSETPFDFVYMSEEYFAEKSSVQGSLAFYVKRDGMDMNDYMAYNI